MKFIGFGGLPRSCSTLMINFLGQNEKFHITPTSGVRDYMMASSNAFSQIADGKANLQYQQLQNQNLYRGAWGFLNGWYTPHQIVFDKGRGWLGSFEFMKKMYEALGASEDNVRIIAPIADLRQVVASLERSWRKHPETWASHVDADQMLSVDKRMKYWVTHLPLGPCLNSIRESVVRGFASKILWVKADEFCADPIGQTERMYNYIGEEFDAAVHNPDQVENITPEHDAVHGIYGDHTLRGKVDPNMPDWNDVLIPAMQQQIIMENRWCYELFYPQVLEETESNNG